MEIAVLGSVNADIVYDVSRLPLAGETLVADRVALGAGGKASNASVALARLGATPRLIGCIGDDALGAGALAALHRAGVATESLRRCGAPTGLATAMVVAGGENMIVTHLGANLQLRPSDIGPLDGCAGLLVTLGLAEETVRAGIARARQAGIPVLVDTTPLRRVPLHPEVTAVDLLSANRVEAEQVTGLPVRDRAGARDAVAALHALGAETVVLKLGAEGALWSDGANSGHVPAVPVEVVDPTGAGDAFMAALAHAWLDGATLADATTAACALAARVVARHGAQGDWRYAPIHRFSRALAAVDCAPGRSAGTTKDPPCAVPGRSTINGAHDHESSTIYRRIRASLASATCAARPSRRETAGM